MSVFFAHNEDDQGGPTGERSASLALACAVVVLLPDKTGPIVLLHDVGHHCLAELRIHLTSLDLMWKKQIIG